MATFDPTDYGTMKQRIREELPRSTSADDARIGMAISDSIKFYRVHKFYWNEFTDQFTTTIGQESYGTVADEGAGKGYDDALFGIDQVYAELSGGRWVPVDEWPFDTIRLWNVATTVQGYPDFYSWHQKKLWVSPPPHVTYDLRIDGIQDIGTIVYAWTDTAWIFYEENGSVVGDSYTNDWFTEGEELIRLHAKVALAENVYKDDREAQRLRAREYEVLAQARERSRAFRSNTYIVPYN
jgi:hypothetical protein